MQPCPSISLNSFLEPGRLASLGHEAQKPPPKPEIPFCQVARSTFSGSDGTPMGSGCVTPVQLAPVGAPRCEETVILFIVSITRTHRTQSKRQNRQAVAVEIDCGCLHCLVLELRGVVPERGWCLSQNQCRIAGKLDCNLQVGQAITLVPMGPKPRHRHQVEVQDVFVRTPGLGTLWAQNRSTVNISRTKP